MTKILAICLAVFSLCGCRCGDEGKKPVNQASSASPESAGPVTLTGIGAAHPLYAKWIAEYAKVRPSAQINYSGTDLGNGLRQVSAESVDFAATDAPSDASDLKSAPHRIIQVPITLGAVALVHSVTDVTDLKLSAQALAAIYLGEIKKWNDKAIALDNPGVKLPNLDVNAVFRSDTTGTTATFTDYLSKVSADFKQRVGTGKRVNWLTGLGAAGNDGVIGQLKTIPGAIAYINLADVAQNGLTMVALKNSAGDYVTPSVAAVSAAAEGVTLGDSLSASITNSSAVNAYPICGFSYILARGDSAGGNKAKAVADFLWWSIHDGQQYAASLTYAPLPQAVVRQIEKRMQPLTSADSR
jgi:phosphate transport system substrate-binding protein